MKKYTERSLKLVYIFFLMQFSETGFSQTPIDLNQIKYSITEYIFIGQPSLWPCDKNGFPTFSINQGSAPFTLKQNFVFTIIDSFTDAGDDKTLYYVISFNNFKTKRTLFESKTKYLQRLRWASDLNLKDSGYFDFKNQFSNSNQKDTLSNYLIDYLAKPDSKQYFAVSENDLKRFAYIFSPKIHWEFALGTVSELIRYRPKVDSIKSFWGTDASFGLSVGAKYNFTSNFGVTGLLGLSITNVTLDSISTRGYLGSSKQHAALTPSFNLLFTYKSFSFGMGVGWDFVNRDSKEVKEWIYNHRMFYGFAFGINIFSNNSNSNNTSPSSNSQTTKK